MLLSDTIYSNTKKQFLEKIVILPIINYPKARIQLIYNILRSQVFQNLKTYTCIHFPISAGKSRIGFYKN